jgi:hypothetical protein
MLDKQADQASPDNVPANDEACTSKLPADLDTMASNATTGGEGRKSNRALARCKDTDEEATADTSDHMGVNNAEDIVNGPEAGESLAENVHGNPGNASGHNTNNDSPPASNHT